jgi:hypothetical protein
MNFDVIIGNPPFLSSNRMKADKSFMKMYGQSDLYKCFLSLITKIKSDKGALVLPSNFLCESNSKARETFFKHYNISQCWYWSEPLFSNATTGSIVIFYEKGGGNQQFPIRFIIENKTVFVHLKKKYGFLWGDEFFNFIDIKPIKILKTDVGMKPPNTKIILGLLDKGKRTQGLSFNYDEDIYCQPKSFTTYQLTIPNHSLSINEQKNIIEKFNNTLNHYRNMYHGLFLSNFMGANQKILNRTWCNKLITKIMHSSRKIHTK